MNAAVDETGDEISWTERMERRLDGRERSWLECRLQAWGDWHENHLDFMGYPRADAVASFLDGMGGGRGGHRILCVEMPKHVQWTQIRVLRLPEHEKIAVWAHYVPWVRESGQVWTAEAKARLLGISWTAYRQRLTRARFRILGFSVQL